MDYEINNEKKKETIQKEKRELKKLVMFFVGIGIGIGIDFILEHFFGFGFSGLIIQIFDKIFH